MRLPSDILDFRPVGGKHKSPGRMVDTKLPVHLDFLMIPKYNFIRQIAI